MTSWSSPYVSMRVHGMMANGSTARAVEGSTAPNPRQQWAVCVRNVLHAPACMLSKCPQQHTARIEHMLPQPAVSGSRG